MTIRTKVDRALLQVKSVFSCSADPPLPRPYSRLSLRLKMTACFEGTNFLGGHTSQFLFWLLDVWGGNYGELESLWLLKRAAAFQLRLGTHVTR